MPVQMSRVFTPTELQADSDPSLLTKPPGSQARRFLCPGDSSSHLTTPALAPLLRPDLRLLASRRVGETGGYGTVKEERPAGALTERYCELTDATAEQRRRLQGGPLSGPPLGPSVLMHCWKWVKHKSSVESSRRVGSAQIRDKEASKQGGLCTVSWKRGAGGELRAGRGEAGEQQRNKRRDLRGRRNVKNGRLKPPQRTDGGPSHLIFLSEFDRRLFPLIASNTVPLEKEEEGVLMSFCPTLGHWSPTAPYSVSVIA
ncbi:hypothetical protein NQZ68_015705 [Dissostichus eleginoides]|nr:hypothetical protein NQZ68_015705 [Dissostichus eleginoides]